MFISITEIFLLILILIFVVTTIAIVIKRKMRPTQEQIELNSTEKLDEYTSSISKEQNIRSSRILKERLAKGEITKKEYDELKKEFDS